MVNIWIIGVIFNIFFIKDMFCCCVRFVSYVGVEFIICSRCIVCIRF